MPGSASSSLADAVLILIRFDSDGVFCADASGATATTDRERLAHANPEKIRVTEITRRPVRRRSVLAGISIGGIIHGGPVGAGYL